VHQCRYGGIDYGARQKYFEQLGIAGTGLASRRSQPEGSGMVETRTSEGDPPRREAAGTFARVRTVSKKWPGHVSGAPGQKAK